MEERYLDVLAEFNKRAYQDEQADTLKLMEISRLERIADALEGIREALEALEPLADCTMKDRQGNEMFYIAGSVTTYEG